MTHKNDFSSFRDIPTTRKCHLLIKLQTLSLSWFSLTTMRWPNGDMPRFDILGPFCYPTLEQPTLAAAAHISFIRFYENKNSAGMSSPVPVALTNSPETLRFLLRKLFLILSRFRLDTFNHSVFTKGRLFSVVGSALFW